MGYHDSVERSAEYLRLALPLMSKQAAALNPICYAVWYDYVSGRNAALKKRIDELTRDGSPLEAESRGIGGMFHDLDDGVRAAIEAFVEG